MSTVPPSPLDLVLEDCKEDLASFVAGIEPHDDPIFVPTFDLESAALDESAADFTWCLPSDPELA